MMGTAGSDRVQTFTASSDELLGPVLARFAEGWPAEVNCDGGWHPIIAALDQKLAEICPNYAIHQVKEKWAGLRYYFELPDSEAASDGLRAAMHRVVDEAERQAARTCERCGRRAAGVFSGSNGHSRTLCRQCSRAGESEGGPYRRGKI